MNKPGNLGPKPKPKPRTLLTLKHKATGNPVATAQMPDTEIPKQVPVPRGSYPTPFLGYLVLWL